MLMPNCARVKDSLLKEMRDYLEQNKRKRPLFQDEGEQAPNVVEVVDVEADASVIHHPSSGTATKQRCATYQFTAAKTKAAPKAAAKMNKTVVEML